jgi:CRP-like cAMP-binding protein
MKVLNPGSGYSDPRMGDAMREPTAASPHVSRGRRIQYQKNRILAALPPDEFQRLAPHLAETPLAFKRSVCKPSEPIQQVCFPDSGVCSVMSVMRTGATAEVATVGNEGVTGVALFFGDASEPSESMIQVPGAGRMLPADVFQEELGRKGALHRLVGHYAHALMIQIMQTAACNALHPLEKRACRWLLMTHDRVFTDEFKLTHEFLGLMLGASRPTVSIVAGQLQRAGLIAYRHGNVTVLDRKGLEAATCECYAIVSNFFDGFLRRLEAR